MYYFVKPLSDPQVKGTDYDPQKIFSEPFLTTIPSSCIVFFILFFFNESLLCLLSYVPVKGVKRTGGGAVTLFK